MSSVLLARHLTLETIELEPNANTIDGQGAPTYNTTVDVQARVLRKNKMLTSAEGSEVLTTLMVWVPGDALVLPSERDRLTWESETYIVVEAKDVKGRDSSLEHRRLRCRRE